MATFRNRHGKWQARVQRKGQQPVSKSFQSKQDGEKWARQIESDIDKGSYTNSLLADRTTFSEVIQRYIHEVTSKTRGRPPSGYSQLDLTDPEQLALGILKTLPKQ